MAKIDIAQFDAKEYEFDELKQLLSVIEGEVRNRQLAEVMSIRFNDRASFIDTEGNEVYGTVVRIDEKGVQLKVEGKEKAKRVIWERIHNIER